MVYWTHSAQAPFSDHTYTIKHGVALDLRIFPADSVSSPVSGGDAAAAPWVLYTHGGAFAAGKHYLPNAWVVPGFRSKGIHVVSVAYRFAPHVDLKGMLEDCVDAWKWCRENLAGVLAKSGHTVDTEKCIVAGESAGGTLCTLLGHVLDPPPRAVVDIYGAIDPLDVRPRSPADIQPLTEGWSEEEVSEAISQADPSQAIIVCPFQFDIPIETIRSQWGVPEYDYTRRQVFQYEIKKYMRTYDLLWTVLFRLDGKEAPKQREKTLKSLSALWMLDEKKIYPPTYFLHGREDPVVPVWQAEKMAEKLRKISVDVGESYEPGEGHEFDNKYTGPEIPGWNQYISPILEFVEKHTQ